MEETAAFLWLEQFYRSGSYDLIIIDSAPIMAADDTTSLAPFVDTVIFVVKLSSTPARLVAQSGASPDQFGSGAAGWSKTRTTPSMMSSM